MGVLGEMFPGKKLQDTGGEDGDGRVVGPRFDIDLDGGVVRMPTLPGRRATAEEPSDAPGPDGGDREPAGD